MTTVENEVNNIRAYLRIQLIMHDHNFRVTEEIDASLFHYEIPKLILQPLVENAIDHGLDLSQRSERQLSITIQEDGTKLVFGVTDNGNGMSKEQADKILGYQSPGYGVHNVYDRIKLLYKEEGSMEIVSREGEGTSVKIVIPKQTKGAQERSRIDLA